MALGDEMILGAEVNHRLLLIQSLRKENAELEARCNNLQLRVNGLELIVKTQRDLINGLKRELERKGVIVV